MIKRLDEVLAGQGDNYIFPFFWQHGEEEKTLREYMGAIHECGIGAVCVECRPHPDFCGERWWHDMDIILDEAKKRNMKVWILDDAHFPTGQANGAMQTAPAELCKQFLFYNVCDLTGPTPDAELKVEKMAHRVKPMRGKSTARGPAREFDDDRVVCVAAARADGRGIDAATLVNLTDRVDASGMLYWDVPDGYWRLFVLYLTRNGDGRPNYINMVSFPSCTQQLKAVYEPHWEHYAAEFGKTIAGFFSDEPELGNTDGGYENWVGRQVPISWSEEVDAALRERLGAEYLLQMPALWYPSADGTTARVRYAYMDAITRLVERDFSMQIGDWCAAHGVKYIGHSIEDNNQHARMGQSLGHHFRGLAGQHMGGVDNILEQVKPGAGRDFRRGSFTFGSAEPEQDGVFYHFVLGKLASSQGHLDPRKQGDSMCELFGAYGWGEGTRLEKYLTDHFLVRGVNHFVPHAFSPKAFPDPDCPPHFYAHGYNPLYRPFGQLMRYMNRMCHLLSGGTHIAPVGLLYHAEAEWAGREEGYMLMQEPARVLLEHQIDYDILWSDLFAEPERYGLRFDGTVLTVGREQFRAVVVPYTRYVTPQFAAFAAQAAQSGFPVIFLNGRPEHLCGALDDAGLLRALSGCRTATLSQLPDLLRSLDAADVRLQTPFADLRYYRYRQEQDLYFFTNEATGKVFRGQVFVPSHGTAVLYDAMQNRVYAASAEQTPDGTLVQLTLRPYESVCLIFGSNAAAQPLPPEPEAETPITGPWTLRFSNAKDRAFDVFSESLELGCQETLHSAARLKPEFSGVVRYECEFQSDGRDHILELEHAFEAAEVFVNGACAGMTICPPYRFDVDGLVRPGKNTLCIDVFTTPQRLVNSIPPEPGARPRLPEDSVLQPYGLMGHVRLLR